MSRIEKKTQIKGLPPQVALNENDSIQGTYPVQGVLGTGSIKFTDTNTIRFASGTIYYGLGLSVTSPYVTQLAYMTSSLTGSGRVVAGVGDALIHITTSLPSSSPFRDDSQFASDAKGFGDPFWATGSNLEGLTAPVWSKNVVEIDFTPLTVSSLTGSQAMTFGTSSYVGYYNFAQRKWQPLLSTATPGAPCDGAGTTYDELLWGFSASHNVKYGLVPTATTARGFLPRGRPISTFGFPFSTRWEATSSNSIPMSNFIDRPFVVEKIFVMMSASFRLSTLPGTLDDARDFNGDPFYDVAKISCSYVINNMFILNQRAGAVPAGLDISFPDPAYDVSRRLNISAGSAYTRDLVGWFDIASFNNDFNFVASSSAAPSQFYRDVTIINASITTATTASWSRLLYMSGSAKSPNSTPMAQSSTNLEQNYTIQRSFYDRTLGQFIAAGWLGSRNGLLPTNASGRDLLNAAGQFSGDVVPDGDYSVQVGSTADSWARPNPYVIFPQDSLILGWHLPTNDDLVGAFNQSETRTTGSFVEFPVAPAKIVLYGSYLADGVGVNPTEQLLASNSIHEAVE